MKLFTDKLKKQTGIIMLDIGHTFEEVTDELMQKEVNGFLMWKHFYHMLNSIDRIFAYSESYQFPDFHEEGLNRLDCTSDKTLSKDRLEMYFRNIREKITTYLDNMDDARLLEEVICQEMRISRFELIIAQFRHITWHLGYIQGCIRRETGKLPVYIGVNKDFYPI
jgi:uncharacterized protein with HEPN domain